ncbi:MULTISPECIES: cyclic nucleotide-binding domain-containing protein [unclassified Synechococcus]|uniref:cyclic nucleotide-binding domain-containing protein n=1 Tax=unclassified Synechococcus TaxID=2626047 RepID=UPI000069943D|nr:MULTISPECIES: cyclic nucleotide-binding domain-containing protein [unclassified Synechococcus]EAQ76247.1 Cyclic nucleotide-binding domain (cNMP-BD) protein [Synechococcus sp. WH 5701]WFN58942.1 cyclic nucleotide-binding domain-containing protein [Synechococcus sp. CCFWC 502]
MTSAATHDKLQRLQPVGIFAATPVEVLLQLAEAVEEVHLAAGEQLFAKGDLGTSMYVIVSGQVRIHIGDQTVVELADGEIVGELAALDPEPRSASVSAIDPTTLYRIEQATLQALMVDHPEIVQAVIKELAQRLRDTTAPYGFG